MRSRLPLIAALLLLVTVFATVILTIRHYAGSEATAVICVSRDPSEDALPDYHMMKSTYALLIESHAVLNIALKDPALQPLGCRNARELGESLRVETGEDELIFVKLKRRPGWSANDTTDALDAIVNTVVDEFVNKVALQKVEELAKVRERYSKTYSEIVVQTEKLKSLARASSGPVDVVVSPEIMAEAKVYQNAITPLRDDLALIQQEKTKLETELDKPPRVSIVQPATFGAN